MEKISEKVKDFVSKHQSLLGFLTLLVFCYVMLFMRLGFYPLIDVDETRYVGISLQILNGGDWIIPFLNGTPFLEKPPLYFWLNALFFNFFGEVSAFSARFGTALLAFLSVMATYLFSKKALGYTYALIASFILLGNVWFLIFSHVAILDMGFMAFTMCAIYCAAATMFLEDEKYKKYCWWGGWLFMGLGVLMKGLIGFIVPALVIFFLFLATKKLKEMFKPVNLIPGLIIFFLATFPWHYTIFKIFGMEWFNEYILKHHFARFMDSSMGLGRKEPLLFYIPIIFVGFLPWTFSFISTLISGTKAIIRDLKATKSIRALFAIDTNDRKVLVFATIYFLVVLIFFSISSTKLPSYILTLFPAISLLTAYYWWGYITGGKFERGIKTATIFTCVIFLLAGILGYIAFTFAVPGEFTRELLLAQSFSSQAIGWITIVPLISLLCLITKDRSLLFISNVVFVLGVILISTTHVFSYITQFGQNELQDYAVEARILYDSRLATFDFSNKYSVMNEFDDHVYYIQHEDWKKLDSLVKQSKEENRPLFVIVKNSNYIFYKDQFKAFKVVKTGIKYTLLVLLPDEKAYPYYPAGYLEMFKAQEVTCKTACRKKCMRQYKKRKIKFPISCLKACETECLEEEPSETNTEEIEFENEIPEDLGSK